MVVDKIAMMQGRFVDEKTKPGVIFQQSLLEFATLYKFSIKQEYAEGIKAMLDKHKHNTNASIKKELSIGMRNRLQQESNPLDINHLKDSME